MSNAQVLMLGTGSFAARILFDAAATAETPVTITIAGRNRERLAWLATAANARAVLFRRPARIVQRHVDLLSSDSTESLLAELKPAAVVQAASAQSASVIARKGDEWSRLVARGGLSATAVFQALLSTRVARAIRQVSPTTRFINCCFPDVVNSMIAGAGLPVLCGIGNVAILSNAFAGLRGPTTPGALRMLCHYQNIGPFRRPPATRSGTPPRVWIGEDEVVDVYRTFADVQLTPEPAIDISGASGVPIALAIAAGAAWIGHVPGPTGLPGGYPVRLDAAGALALDLPAGLTREAAIHWNARYEEENGLVVERDGKVRYTGALADMLRAASPELASGFRLAELDDAYKAMAALRAKLQDISARE